jgi:hypothetical protein
MPKPKDEDDLRGSLICLLEHTKIAIEKFRSLEKSALVALRGIGENKLDTDRFHSAIDNIKKTGKLGSKDWHVTFGEIKESRKLILKGLTENL